MDMNFTSDGDRIALMMMIIAREMANMMAMAMITANLIVILRLFLEQSPPSQIHHPDSVCTHIRPMFNH